MSDGEIDQLGHPAPEDADFGIACWRCDVPSPADVYARVIRNEDDPLKTTRRSGHAICESHLEQLRSDDDAEVNVLAEKTKTLHGVNRNQTLSEVVDGAE